MKTFVRSVSALAAAALAPAALFLAPLFADFLLCVANDRFAWSRFSKWLLAVLGTSVSFVVLFGVPVFLMLLWRNAIRWWSAIVAGFAVAGLPIAYGLWPYSDPSLQTTASHWNVERMVQTMIDGVPTLDGWIEYAVVVGEVGLFGAVGGFAGWFVWHILRPSSER